MNNQEELYQQSIKLLAWFIIGSLFAMPIILIKAMLL